MTTQQREEFWRRFHAEIERFRESGTDCDIVINSFEGRQWDVKFTRRRAGYSPATMTLAIFEHAPSREQFLLAVTPTYAVGDVITNGERSLIPVFFDPVAGTFSLHADQGPIEESQMTEFFARTVNARLNRL